MLEFSSGDRVKVEYRFQKFYEGTVIYTEKDCGLTFVYVRPDDSKYISTFGAAHDMSLGYKGYIHSDCILNKVYPI